MAPGVELPSTNGMPFHRSAMGLHSWTDNLFVRSKKKRFRRKGDSGRGEKDRLTVQVSITKDVKKLKLLVVSNANQQERLVKMTEEQLRAS